MYFLGMSLFCIHLFISENNCQHVRHKPYTVHRTRHPHQGRLEHEYHATYKMITQKIYVGRCRVKFGNLICIRHLFRTSPKFEIYFQKRHVFIHACAASIALPSNIRRMYTDNTFQEALDKKKYKLERFLQIKICKIFQTVVSNPRLRRGLSCAC